MLSLSLSRSITTRLHSPTPHDTSLTIITPSPSINHPSTQYSHHLLPYRYEQLNEAFRNYQQAGQNLRAKSCLKYVALTSMLSRSEINPFDAREAKVFERDTDIVAMTQLRVHLQDSDLRRFENVLLDKKNGITDDSFMMQYIHPLRTHMREKVLITITRPYVLCSMFFTLFLFMMVSVSLLSIYYCLLALSDTT